MATQLTASTRATTRKQPLPDGEKERMMMTVGLVLLIFLALVFTVARHVTGN